MLSESFFYYAYGMHYCLELIKMSEYLLRRIFYELLRSNMVFRIFTYSKSSICNNTSINFPGQCALQCSQVIRPFRPREIKYLYQIDGFRISTLIYIDHPLKSAEIKYCLVSPNSFNLQVKQYLICSAKATRLSRCYPVKKILRAASTFASCKCLCAVQLDICKLISIDLQNAILEEKD